ncbi:MAG: UDP-N-acetylmuramoyl-tripeptide--D-alanyl-D-alanine ligase [Desulfomicrobiaceae bacterium]
MRMSMETIAQAVGVPFSGQNAEVTGVTMDSRRVRPGDLFVAVPGTRVDGHDFAKDAIAAGAVAVLALRPLPVAAPVLVVPDTVRALGLLARAWRETTRARVVAVTGSAGKTTVKEVLALALSTQGKVGKNPGNFNNQLGLPLSILALDGDEDFWVLEVGISQPQDMDELGAILAPDVALITNAGLAHAEALGGVEGVARHKARLLAWLRPGGVGVWNMGCPELHAACAQAGCPSVTFAGRADVDADVRVLARHKTPTGFAFTVACADDTVQLQATAACAHAENVAAVVAVARALRVPMTAVESGLLAFSPQAGRFVCRARGPWVLIDDTYNANPLSMAAAFAEARQMAGTRPLVAVLGEMRELGVHAPDAHRRLGELARAAQCPLVVYRGAHAEAVAAGLGPGAVLCVTDTPKEAWEAFAALRLPNAVLLFKGSRGSRMEEFLAYFEERLS